MASSVSSSTPANTSSSTTSIGLNFTETRVRISNRQLTSLFSFFILPLLCVTGLFGNLLVCLAIWFDRRLQNVTNYFLFSLALADLLVCSIVMPLSILIELAHGIWIWSYTMCQFYVYSDVFLCSASIVHMCIISFDRYLGISKPLKTRNKSCKMITMKIAIVWISTVLISCPIAIASAFESSNIFQHKSCAISNRYFMIYGSTFAFLIPFLIMLVTYIRTTKLLNKQVKALWVQPCHPATSRESSKTAFDSNGIGLRRTIRSRRSNNYLSVNNEMTQSQSSNASSLKMERNASPLRSYIKELQLSDDKIVLSVNEKRPKKVTLLKNTSKMLSTFRSRLRHRQSWRSQSQELASEHKATRVLAVVFCCFFICWTPFFGANFAFGFCGEACAVPPAVASIFLWLGYFSSTINPIIYTIFNRRFRQAFLRIIRCQCTQSPSNHTSYSKRYTTLQYEQTEASPNRFRESRRILDTSQAKRSYSLRTQRVNTRARNPTSPSQSKMNADSRDALHVKKTGASRDRKVSIQTRIPSKQYQIENEFRRSISAQNLTRTSSLAPINQKALSGFKMPPLYLLPDSLLDPSGNETFL